MDAEQKRKEAEERARKIIDAYFAGKLSGDLYKRTLDWLISRMGESPVEDMLLDRWMDSLRAESGHDARTVAGFDKAMQQLGFPEDVRVRLSDVRKPAPKLNVTLRSIMLRAAAVLIPVLIAGTVWLWIEGASDPSSGLAAEVSVSVTDGLQKHITLSDGSEVWLNSGGSLEFNGDHRNRRVATLKGEAFFKVARDEQRPFVVTTRDAETTVLGTEFNVRSHEGSAVTEIALASGSVKVKAGRNRHTLEPGHMLVHDNTTGKAEISKVEVSQIAGWRSEVQSLANRTLGDILRCVCRYYGHTLTMECELSGEPYSVTFRGEEPIENLLRPLSALSGEFTYKVEGGNVIIYGLNEQ